MTEDGKIQIGKAKKGYVAVFQCGRNILRRRIIKREEGNLTDFLRKDKYKSIIPSANTLEEAINYIKRLYGTMKESLRLTASNNVSSKILLALGLDTLRR